MKEIVYFVEIDEAKRKLSKLVDQAAKGDPFMIAKDGKPLVKVTAIDAPKPRKVQRLGFMKGQMSIPEDFDRMGGFDLE